MSLTKDNNQTEKDIRKIEVPEHDLFILLIGVKKCISDTSNPIHRKLFEDLHNKYLKLLNENNSSIFGKVSAIAESMKWTEGEYDY